MGTKCMSDTHAGQKGASDSLALSYKWVLGTKPRSSGRMAMDLN